MILINALAVAAYLGVAFYVLRRFQRHAVMFGYITFVWTWALVSCFYNDLGIYNLELFRWTETTLATTRLVLFLMVFNLGFFFMARLVGDKPLSRTDYDLSLQDIRLGHLRLAGYVGGAILVAYLAYTLLADGVPLLSGMGRHDYFQQAGLIQKNILIYGPLIAFLCGYHQPRKGRWPLGAILMALLLAYAVLVGNKFSLLALLSVVYLVPVMVRNLKRDPQYRLFTLKRLVVLVAAAGILLAFVFGNYFRWHGDRELAFNYMYNRVLAFQGEMWWAVDNDIMTDGRYDRDHWKAEWDSVVDPGNPDNGEVGLRYLMVKVLGPEKAYPIIDGGYLYTGTYPAILIATFPYGIALAVNFLAGLIYFLMLYYLHYSVLYRHMVRSALMILILIPYTVTLISGSLATVLTLGFLVKLGLIAIAELGVVATRRQVEPA
jgi:hypothetical protein